MRVVLAFNEAFNCHDTAGMLELLSEDCIFEYYAPAPDGTRYSGKKEIKQYWQEFFVISPQAHIEIEEIFGLGEHCIMRWEYTWENVNGKNGRLRGVDIFLVRKGSVVEMLSYVKG
jgi:ketosteroid isomerase-like protein